MLVVEPLAFKKIKTRTKKEKQTTGNEILESIFSPKTEQQHKKFIKEEKARILKEDAKSAKEATAQAIFSEGTTYRPDGYKPPAVPRYKKQSEYEKYLKDNNILTKNGKLDFTQLNNPDADIDNVRLVTARVAEMKDRFNFDSLQYIGDSKNSLNHPNYFEMASKKGSHAAYASSTGHSHGSLLINKNTFNKSLIKQRFEANKIKLQGLTKSEPERFVPKKALEAAENKRYIDDIKKLQKELGQENSFKVATHGKEDSYLINSVTHEMGHAFDNYNTGLNDRYDSDVERAYDQGWGTLSSAYGSAFGRNEYMAEMMNLYMQGSKGHKYINFRVLRHLKAIDKAVINDY